MEHSSQTISLDALINSAMVYREVILHNELLSTDKGILNVKWAGLPPFNSKAAVPLEAADMAVFSVLRTRFKRENTRQTFRHCFQLLS